MIFFNRYRRLVLFISSSIFIILALIFRKSINPPPAHIPTPPTAQIQEIKSDDFLGVWVSYIDLEINNPKDTEKAFKKKFDQILDKSEEYNINNIFVHVRPFCDALYPSKIFPWSHLLTGFQGVDPKFDPLEYMIEESHKRNMKFHAWINPLRVKLSTCPKDLSDKNILNKLSPDKFLNSTQGTFLNPAYEEVQNLIINGIKEIITNYKVDGIHFDDYFYPEVKYLTSQDCAYEENSNNTSDINTWRKNAITNLIKKTYGEIKSINPEIKFGISPPGNPKKCDIAGIDVSTLCGEKDYYLDYICPQIYWSLEFKEMPFEKTANTWKAILGKSPVDLYGGIALYKIGTDLDNGTWKSDQNILSKEITILENLGYKGVSLYSWKQLCPNFPEILSLKEKLKSSKFGF